MGNQESKKNRNSNISNVSYGRSISTAPTNESRVLRFTTDGSMSSSIFGVGVESYFTRLPNRVVDGICKFLTIKDLTNLYCTSRFVYERFYTSLPYSIQCGHLLYKLYEDKRGIAMKAVETKHASWPQVLEGFMRNRQEMKNLQSNLKESLMHAYQEHIIYPPLLIDEVTREGLNSDFQRQIMQKLSSVQEYKSITEIQMLNKTRACFKKSSNSSSKMMNTMLEIRTLRQYNTSSKSPELFNIIILILSAIKSLLQIIALTLECAAGTEDNIGLLDFYLYNYEMYQVWMQYIDEHVTPYFNMFDIILKEQVSQYNFPPLTIQWVMMKMWNQHIYSKCRHHLRIIFLQQIKQVRINHTLKYEQYLLKDYIKSLIDLSTTQSNVTMAGNSKFKFIKDLENLFPIINEQTLTLQVNHTIDFNQDIKILGYIFSKPLLENNIIPLLLETKYQSIQVNIKQIQQSPEFSRRIQKYNDEYQFTMQQADYSFQLLNINKVFYKIKSIINCEPMVEQHIRLTIHYQKNTYDKLTVYVKDYHSDLYEEIQKLADLDVVSQESMQIRDAMVLYRTQNNNYENHLIEYDDLIEVEQLKQIIKSNSVNNSKKNSLKKKNKLEPPRLQQQTDLNTFLPITIVAGFNLAQSLTEQYISQQ